MEEIEKEIAKILAGGDMYGDHVYVTEKLKELITRMSNRERDSSPVYEVWCWWKWGVIHQIGVYDSEEKAEKAREQFLLEVEEIKAKYPCPYPRQLNKFLRDKWVDDDNKNEKLIEWFHSTPASDLYSVIRPVIRELKINEYHFLPIREDKIDE